MAGFLSRLKKPAIQNYSPEKATIDTLCRNTLLSKFLLQNCECEVVSNFGTTVEGLSKRRISDGRLGRQRIKIEPTWEFILKYVFYWELRWAKKKHEICHYFEPLMPSMNFDAFSKANFS
jgi:hypothetical protein